MKYVIFIPDGSSDYPVDELDGKTPLMVANTPNIDKLAKMGFDAESPLISLNVA